MSKINLYDTLNSSYGIKKGDSNLEKKGYIKDSKLSNHNQQVWYNPRGKDLLVNVAGSHNIFDAGTDVYLAFGGLKSTNRYKEADKILKEAKSKYQPKSTLVSGHSLGSQVGAGITSKSDRFVGLDGGYTFGQKTRSNGGNHEHYRTSGDIVSLLGSGAKNMKTLKNPNQNTVLDAIGYSLAPLTYGAYKAYQAHTDFSNIKDKQIRIR